MKILNTIKGSDCGRTCRSCAHFRNDPALMEEAFPGLAIMSSGFASVRDQDGLCDHHQVYLSARDSCPRFTPHAPEHDH